LRRSEYCVLRITLGVYVDQTIQVLEAHLKMAENLQRDGKEFGTLENTANNQDWSPPG
jgi:hypothetical protein